MIVNLTTKYELDDSYIKDIIREFAYNTKFDPDHMTITDWQEFLDDNYLHKEILPSDDLSNFITSYRQIRSEEQKCNIYLQNIHSLIEEAIKEKVFSSVEECLEAIKEVS